MPFICFGETLKSTFSHLSPHDQGTSESATKPNKLNNVNNYYPFWKTQPWYLRLLKLLAATPFLLPKSQKLLSILKTKKIHPMWRELQLIACHLLGKAYISATFQKTLNSLYSNYGEHLYKPNINQFWKNGTNFALNNRLIAFNPL